MRNGDGPCLVLAGAGSGKTRTIAYRVAYLLEQGIRPENILLVTFTNKAAEEMKERVARLVNGEAVKTMPSILPWSGTFHHIGYRILRQYAPLVGYKNNFTVLDSDDSDALIRICLKETRVNTESKFPSAAVARAIISYARNSELPIATVLENRFSQWISLTQSIEEIAREYEKKKTEANAMDFDDLLTNLLRLLNDPKTQQRFADQFQYILVDEYQDTNHIQAAIIKKFAAARRNVLVVGDDAQSIYSFRAADIQNILGFEKQYQPAKIFKLEINYRSTKPILDVANSVIANNFSQYRKNLHPEEAGKTPGAPQPALFPQIDQSAEAAFVTKKIKGFLSQGVLPQEIAVLFRAAYHSQMLEVELVREGIEYDYRGGVRFFERAHIKDALAYLRLLNNLADTAAWLRVLMHEEGIGPAGAERVAAAARQVQQIDEINDIGTAILSAKGQVGWSNFLRVWQGLLAAPARAPAALISALLATPYREYLEAEYVDSRDRLADIKQLALFAQEYDALDKFLADTTLQESFRAISDGAQPQPSASGKIVLSTIHQAKGLEWNSVFIINLSAGGFPSDRALREENGLEEERRLFYVAITRAKRNLLLTYPMSGGAFGDFLSGPSLFLNEIEPDLLEDHSLLSINSTVLDDESADVHYLPEDRHKMRPGSFLKEIEDL